MGKRSVELEFAEQKGLDQTSRGLTEQLNKHLKANLFSFSVLKVTGHTVKVVVGRKLNLIVEPAKYFAEALAYLIVGCALATIVGFLEDGLESDMWLMLFPITVMLGSYIAFFIGVSNFLVHRSILILQGFFDELDA